MRHLKSLKVFSYSIKGYFLECQNGESFDFEAKEHHISGKVKTTKEFDKIIISAIDKKKRHRSFLSIRFEEFPITQERFLLRPI